MEQANSDKNFLTQSPYSDIKLEDCNWYHDFEFIRGNENIKPHFNLEPIIDNFLLPDDMTGKTFLDIGTGNGFFTFEMEKRGADVVSFDLAVDKKPDGIPYYNVPDRTGHNKEFMKRFQKGYWYSHKYFNSKARAVYGNVMYMPEWLGKYDVTLLGSILQHLRDPLGAIIQADKHTRNSLIICEAFYKSEEPVMRFQAMPDVPNPQYWTWWLISPTVIVSMLKTLGYKEIVVHGPFNMFNIEGQYNVSSFTVKGDK